ncbi:MAG: TPM domain-containing protein [Moheibacter sp.]
MKKLIPLFIALIFAVGCETSKVEVQYNEVQISQNEFPKPLGYVSDFDHIFTESQKEELTEILSTYEAGTNRKIMVTTLTGDLSVDNFDSYAIDLSYRRGVGSPEIPDGMAIIFSEKLRRIRITTGIETKYKITDEMVSQTIDNIITPEFKEGEYFAGIMKGIEEFMRLWE